MSKGYQIQETGEKFANVNQVARHLDVEWWTAKEILLGYKELSGITFKEIDLSDEDYKAIWWRNKLEKLAKNR